MFGSLKKWLSGWLRGGPHTVIGPPDRPYLYRWHLLPRNRFFNAYLHKFLRDDDDRALHDHPWCSLSVLLRGRYLEQQHGKTPLGGPAVVKEMRSWGWFFRGTGALPVIFRRATHAHRVELVDGKPAWTLFLTGPKVREWGYRCPRGWVHWRKLMAPGNENHAAKGCDDV